jgi:hypothetical protein
MNVATARNLLRQGDLDGQEFALLQLIARLLASDETAGRELLIRTLDLRDHFGALTSMLNGLLAAYGLFPYLDTESATLSEALAYEAHRPLDYDNEGVVFHRMQADVYQKLLDGESVILSAPTSFGKSLVLDAVAASGRFNNIAVVVPTLALIDETRRRLSRLRENYKIVTHPSQSLGDRNIIVMTQERLLEVDVLPDLDLFMIDEFYKLDGESEEHRSGLLNQALRRLMKRSRAFYMAGPNVKALAETLPENFTATFTATDFTTVTTNVRILPKPPRGEEIPALVEVCGNLDGPTLIYCSSPEKTRRVAAAVLDAGLGTDCSELQDAAGWIADEYHPDWLVVRALREGIGIHHARLPRWLGQYTVGAFNDGHLRFLVCTSTLIEGVNTSAKNVVVFDHQIGRRRRALDYFTYSNIAGRSGRMQRHFVGEVFVFREPPHEELPIVDVPIYSQGPDISKSLLIQLDENELTQPSRERLSSILDNEVVPVGILRDNRGVDPDRQIALARALEQDLRRTVRLLAWQGFPTYDELDASCRVVVEHLRPISGRDNGVSSYRQLAFKLNMTAALGGDVRQLIGNELANGPVNVRDNPDAAVEEVLAFVRQWIGFEMPRLLSTLQSIVNHVLQRRGLSVRANYAPYLARCEGLFLPPHVAMLDEFGMPAQLVMKLSGQLPRADAGLDPVLAALRSISPQRSDLSSAEAKILREVQDSL